MRDDEQVNVFDNNGKLIGPMMRKLAEAENLRTENVVVFLYTTDGKLWLQQRALYKQFHPGLWDVTACGGMEPHETAKEAAARELIEETGLQPELQYVKSAARDIPHNGILLHRYSHIYTGITDEQPVPNEEVIDFHAWDVEDLYKDIDEHPDRYIDRLGDLIALANTKNPSS